MRAWRAARPPLISVDSVQAAAGRSVKVVRIHDRRLFTGTSNRTVQVWGLHGRSMDAYTPPVCMATYKFHTSEVETLRFDGSTLLVSGGLNELVATDVRHNNPRLVLPTPCYSLDLSTDQWTIGGLGNICTYDPRADIVTHRMHSHTGTVLCLQRRDVVIWSGDRDGRLVKHDLRDTTVPMHIEQTEGAIRTLQFDHANLFIGGDRQLSLRSSVTGAVQIPSLEYSLPSSTQANRPLSLHSNTADNTVTSLQFDSKKLICAYRSKPACVWDIRNSSDSLSCTVYGQDTTGLESIHFDNQSELLVGGDRNGYAHIWRFELGLEPALDPAELSGTRCNGRFHRQNGSGVCSMVVDHTRLSFIDEL
eukprot:GILJ01026134.1.p1 GENE.GILJ01026134.1~~GILJ01026134.1.p1  ORF type:complete len:363 (+),score=20.87 GILJ01026134.1:169-1257(+)